MTNDEIFSKLQGLGLSPEEAWQAMQDGTATKLLSPGILGSVKDWYSKHIGPGKSLVSNVKIPDLKSGLQNIGKTQLAEGGPTLGQVGGALYFGKQGLDLINQGSNLGNSYSDLNDLRNKTLTAAYSNPMVNSYLDPEAQRTLRQLKNGTFMSQNPIGSAAGGVASSIPDALKGALFGYLSTGGNALGALAGGATALGKGAMSGMQSGNNEKSSKLEALYQQLQDANQEYRAMRRPANLRSAGLQSRYQNQLW